MTDTSTSVWQQRLDADLQTHFPGEMARIDRAARQFTTDSARLLRPDGSRLYSDDEHAQRVAGLLAAFDQVGAEVTATAQAGITDAERELARLAGATPIDRLSAAELERANLRATFIREDAESLPPEQLVPRLRAALAGGDRVELTLWHRYAAKRLDQTPPNRRGELQPEVRALEERLADPRARETRERLERKIEMGKYLAHQPAARRREIDGSEARAFAEQRRQTYASF